MTDYRRLISYIYEYEGKDKGKNTGFVKLETRNGQCRLNVSVKKIYMGGNPIGVYLLGRGGKETFLGNLFVRGGNGEFRASVDAGNVDGAGTGLELYYGLSIHDVKNSWRSYRTIWEDVELSGAEEGAGQAGTRMSGTKKESGEEKLLLSGTKTAAEILPGVETLEPELVIANAVQEIEEEIAQEETHAGQMEEFAKTEFSGEMRNPEGIRNPGEMKSPEKTEGSGEAENPGKTEGSVGTENPGKTEDSVGTENPGRVEGFGEIENPRKTGDPGKIEKPEKTEGSGEMEASRETVQSPELENPEVLKYLQEMEAAASDPEQLWAELRKSYPKIQAFDYEDGCEILTIRPQDIGRLPRESWGYGNNSFLLHGYYSFRYIILFRLGGGKGKPRYLIGVPGHYYSNEKYMASMFGFPNFVLSKKQPPNDGRFGYWYADIRIR